MCRGGEASSPSSDHRRNLNALFGQCVDNLGSDHSIRVVYALQTLCGAVRAVSARKGSGGSNANDLVHLLVGADAAEQRMAKLVQHLNT